MTTYRPHDWHPLTTDDRYRDPTPGNPHDIRTGRRHMADTAIEIRTQITRLRAIAAGDGLTGQYADTLTDSADRLRGKLEKIADRYESVAVKVSTWADAVEEAQDATHAAHRSATSADHVITQLEALPEDGLSTTQKSDLDDARTSLSRAQSRFESAVDDYHADARRIAGQIEDLLDDSIEDSWWSWTSNLIERNAEMINDVLEVVGWIATIVAIAAVVIACAPAAPAWLALAATWAMAGAEAATYGTAVIHAAMAATGNGTWADVGLDLVAIATMRMGKAAEKGIEVGTEATRAASRQAAKDAVAAARADQSTLRQSIASELRNKSLPKQRRQYLQGELKQLDRKARSAGHYPSQHTPDVSNADVWRAGGSRDTAVAQKISRHEAAKHSTDAAVQTAAHRVEGQSVKNLRAFAIGTGADAADKIAGSSNFVAPSKPSVEEYDNLKNFTQFQTHWVDPDLSLTAR